MRSPKSVDDQDCLPTDGSAYTGTTNTTNNGFTCQNWSVDTPHDLKDIRGLLGSDVNHNYCRDPLGYGSLYCATTHPDVILDLCDVPACQASYKGEIDVG